MVKVFRRLKDGKWPPIASAETSNLMLDFSRLNRMESTLTLSPAAQIGSVGSVASVRLPSLDDLLESEVILGDDDDDLGADSDDDSEMHSALEDLPPEPKIPARPEPEIPPVPTADSVPPEPVVAPTAPEESPVKVRVTPPATPTSGSNTSGRNSASRSPAPPVRTPNHQPAKRVESNGGINGLSTPKSRYTSPYAPRRSLSVLGAPTSPGLVSSPASSLSVSMTSSPVSQPSTPIATRRPPSSTSRPKLPTLIVRQPSNLKSASSPPSGVTSSSTAAASPRRSSSVAPAARAFQAGGKQTSVIVGRSTGGVASSAATTPPRRPDEGRFATLGRKSTKMSPSATQTGYSICSESANQRDPSSTRETKAAADKFATLPRRPKAKERPPLPPKILKTPESIDPGPGSSLTLPRPKKTPPAGASVSSPSKPAVPPKPKIVLYMEKGAQTEVSQQDVKEGLEAAQRLRALSRQPQVSAEEVRELERLLQQSKEEANSLRQQLDEEREERHVVQQELERTTQRVAAMLDSMEGVEKEFHTRGDSLVQLETSLHTSTHAIYALQEQLEAQDAALIAQRLELDRSLIAQKNLIQQMQENESESREMMEFLQAEKVALNDALRDSESEIGLLKSQLDDYQQQLANKEEECLHLVRLTEQRRHELAALQAEMKGAEGRTGSALLAQGAQLSAASLALFRLTSRLDAMLSELMNHHLSPEEMDAMLQPDRRSSINISTISEPLVDSVSSPTADSVSEPAGQDRGTPREENFLEDTKRPDEESEKPKQFHPLVGSTSLQDLSDAINLSRRRPPEGREEPMPAVDEELRLASSFVDQLEEADQVLSKLMRLVERVLQDKDTRLQSLGDEKEQLLATLSAQGNVLQEAKDELGKLRRTDEQQYELGLKVQQLQSKLDQAYEEISRLEKADSPDGDVYFGKRGSTWNDEDDDNITTQQWISVVSKVLESLPEETLESNPSLESLRLQLQLISRNGQDPNANGTG